MQVHQAGRIGEAQEMYRAFLRAAPDHPEALHLLGVTWCQLNQPDRGLPHLKRAVAAMPRHAAARNSLGNALRAMGRHRDALAEYDRALALTPDVAVLHYNCGAALVGLGRHEEAIACYQRALALSPGYGDAFNNLGNSLGALGRAEEAIAQYQQALAVAPDHAEAMTNLGVAFGAQGRYDEALAWHDRALALRPDLVKAHCNRGDALVALRRPAEGVACYRAALALFPRMAEAHNHLGVALGALNRHEEAIAHFEQALAIDRANPETLNNLGTALIAQNRHELAIRRFDQALALKPDHAEAAWNKSLALLVQGKFAQGFKLYEQRWRCRANPRLADFGLPLWLGRDDITGRKLLIQAEQGLGDAIQMLRYVPRLEAAGAECWLQLPDPLSTLAARSFPHARMVSPDYPPADADCRIPVMSLPLALRTVDAGSIPRDVPYLRADAGQIAHWRARLGDAGKPRIGLVWRGAATHQNDANRSLPLTLLAPLLARDDIHFVTLQKDLTEPERALLATLPNVSILDAELASLDDTAAVLPVLDRMVSVDSAPAHLAAALGRPTHILLPWSPDWRWLLGRGDTPWYPTATLHRQPAAGDWPAVVAAICDVLAGVRA